MIDELSSYQNILEFMNEGFAYHKIVLNEDNEPIDYIFIDVNTAFEEITGLKKADIINKRVTKVLPGIEHGDFDLIETYGKIALNGSSYSFEQFSINLNKWFKVSAYSNKQGYFVTIFYDITEIKNSLYNVKRMSQMLVNYLEFPLAQIDYQMITDDVKELSGAAYIVLNMIDHVKNVTVTKSISGDFKNVSAAARLFGFDFINREWSIDEFAHETMKTKKIRRYKGLSDISSMHIMKAIAKQIEGFFNLGEIVAIGISKGDLIVGDILIVMPKNKKFFQDDIIELFANQLGIVFVRKQLEEEQRQYDEQIQFMSIHDRVTGLYNRIYFEEKLAEYDDERYYPISLLIGDVNGLKLTNDVFGHQMGDELLKVIADILKNVIQNDGIITRWGGDEFSIILPNTTINQAENICINITKQLNKKINSLPLQPSLSLGAATKEDNGVSMQYVLKEAEDRMYRHKLLESRSFRNGIISSLTEMMLERDFETNEHAERITRLCGRVGEAAGLSDSDKDALNLLAILHDIGKIAVPDHILLKPDKLTTEESEEMKKHTEIGYRIASSTQELSHIADYILSHHERWDGSGYPRALRGTEIPKCVRVLSIVDAYDAMTSQRPYKKPIPHELAVKEIIRCSGTQFDPELVKIFAKIANKSFNI